MLACPIRYCKAFGFIPAFAILVQNVCRRVWGVVIAGKASSWLLLYFSTNLRNIFLFSGKEKTAALIVISKPPFGFLLCFGAQIPLRYNNGFFISRWAITVICCLSFHSLYYIFLAMRNPKSSVLNVGKLLRLHVAPQLRWFSAQLPPLKTRYEP